MIEVLGVGIALAVAFNIGANNAGITMGPVYGAGVRSKFVSLVLIAIFNVLGALAIGTRGIKNVGAGLFTASMSEQTLLFLIVAPSVALALLVLANVLRTPISTTHAAISSLLGVGLYLDTVNVRKVLEVFAWWASTPVAAVLVTYAVGKVLLWKWPGALETENLSPRTRRILGALLTVAGCYVAFTIGANNVSNATAVLYGAGMMTPVGAALLAGAGMAVGALVLGGRVMETVAKGITELCHVRAIAVAFVSGTITLAAAWGGVPISKTLIVTCGVIGFGLATEGARATSRNSNVRRIIVLWTLGPLIAVAITYGLVAAGPFGAGAVALILVAGTIYRLCRMRKVAHGGC